MSKIKVNRGRIKHREKREKTNVTSKTLEMNCVKPRLQFTNTAVLLLVATQLIKLSSMQKCMFKHYMRFAA